MSDQIETTTFKMIIEPENLLYSTEWSLLAILALLVSTFLTRLPWASQLGSDFYTQLWLIKQFRQSKRWIKPIFSDSLIGDAGIFYPPFPSSLLARLPDKWVIPAGICINYAFDALLAIFIFIILRYFQIDPVISLLAALLWSSLPILHPVNARLVGLGARTLGPMLFFCWCIFAYVSLEGNWIVGLFGMLLVSTAITMSSQMALQNVLLQSAVISLLYLNPLPLIAVLSGLIIAASFGMYDSFILKLLHIRWYLAYGRRFLCKRNNPRHLLITAKKNLIQAMIFFMINTTPGVIFIGFLGLIPVLPIILDPNVNISLTPFLFFCGVVFAGAIFCCLATIKGPLEVFGESERYLEYASPFVVVGTILFVRDIVVTQELLLGIILSLFGVFLNLFLSNVGRIKASLIGSRFKDDVEEVRSVIQSMGARRIATSPISLASKLSVGINASDQFKFLHVLLIDKARGLLPWPTSVGMYPYLDTRPDFLNSYDIDTVIIAREHLLHLPVETDAAALSGWKIHNTESFVIFTR